MPAQSAVTAVTEKAEHIRCGPLSALIVDGALRCIAFDGVEVVRGIDCPMRDANWGTAVPEDVSEHLDRQQDSATYRRQFAVFDGVLSVNLTVQFGPDGVRLDLTAKANARVQTNRAGFTLLHPLDGVAGAPVTIVHSDGSEEQTAFPSAILAGQPAFDIAGLRHTVQGVSVDIAFGGEVFEMEDQRNWTDASFKTYCRPLSLPFPYVIEAGETIDQSITIKLGGSAAPSVVDGASDAAVSALPEVALAVDPAWRTGAQETVLAHVPSVTSLVRLDLAGDDLVAAASDLAKLGGPIELELIVDDDGDTDAAMAGLAGLLRDAGISPASVVALPRAYLKSYQPTDQWPAGHGVGHGARAAGRAFADARIGVGMLTNFTELNRHVPPPDIGDFVTYSTTAIVHAADDRSVFETLEALLHVHRSAAELAGSRPLRTGLASIGMRSNPYGAAVADNPDRQRIAMAMDDPRQRTVFGAAFAVGAYTAAADCGVARIALAGVGGPFATGTVREGRFIAWPVHHSVARLAAMSAGQRIANPPLPGSVRGVQCDVDGQRLGVFANCGLEPATVALGGQAATVMTEGNDVADPAWLDHARPVSGDTVDLTPGAVLFTKGDAA